ncbi:heavy metal translocating P-type ATPase [Pseudalkalibacillus caeni]|uniref:Cadmium-translocating P-type ATPase n=1 Tax=Exobacillus caeni TaxID=2574798 RepID=A0A5R9EZW3_9BACL|nr:heavy metal translocating P-type ATPase [Pseudalkalibacillus caeni]TLS35736.1 cadmium-translocating P-type ATPase [Pseudalkalibacillus caeni]
MEQVKERKFTQKIETHEPADDTSWLDIIKPHLELVAALLSGTLIAIAWTFDSLYSSFPATPLFILAFLIGGYAKAKEGIEELIFDRSINVEILMIIAAIGAGIIGYWTEGAILIFIFSLSGALETYTLNKSERELESLMEIQPETATMLINGQEKTVAVSSLSIGDKIVVKPGERIPADGIIQKGKTTVDQATITGESLPVEKEDSADVFAGTLNLTGHITISITKRNEDTVFQKIINLVQEAKSEKAPSQLFIEKMESVYVKTVLIAAAALMFLPHYLIGWSWEETLYRAMVFLVVASPCALVASIMPATLAAISAGARNGILFKGGVHLEHLASIKAIAFDKTGTLTKGTPIVTDVFTRNGLSVKDFLTAVAAVEKQSTHPLAKAIVSEAESKKLLLPTPDEMQDTSGWGVEALIDGEKWRIGKKEFFKGYSGMNDFEEILSTFQEDGKTIVLAGDKTGIAGIIALKDVVRNEAIDMVRGLQRSGIHSIMITGDSKKTANAIAREVGIEEYIAECLPETKVDEVNSLKTRYKDVAMIGDGINDAPALATANVGIAMGNGTDVALETADIVLMKNDLSKITKSIKISKKLNSIIKQNVFFSIAVILLLILSNFLQALSLPLGVIGHEGSTILVILNGLRMLKN